MANNTTSSKRRKTSNRPKVSKEVIQQAKYAKQKGLIQKSAKLTNGRVSRAVLRKVTHLEKLGVVPTYIFREGSKKGEILNAPTKVGVKLKSKKAKEAKARGFELFNGHTIVEKSREKEAKQAVSEGRLVGLDVADIGKEDGKRRVVTKISRISLTKYKINTFGELIEALRHGELDTTAKRPDEWFTFTFYDFHPNPEATFNFGQRRHAHGTSAIFPTGKDLAEYLLKYEKIYESYDQMDNSADFDHFELYRTIPGYELGLTPDYVYRERRMRYMTVQDRRQANRIKKMRAKAEKMKQEFNRETYLEQKKKENNKYRSKLTETQKEEIRRKNREYVNRKRGKS